MATGGVAQKSLSSDGSTVRLFVTSYTDDFFAEREILKKEVKHFSGHRPPVKALIITEPT